MAEDEIADLADRMLAKHRRGEDAEFEFAIEWGALTDAEREDFMALMRQRIAHREERLDVIEETNRLLTALVMLIVRSNAPAGMTLTEALDAGYVGWMEVIETIRSEDEAIRAGM